jgi:hypothetical protein
VSTKDDDGEDGGRGAAAFSEVGRAASFESGRMMTRRGSRGKSRL